MNKKTFFIFIFIFYLCQINTISFAKNKDIFKRPSLDERQEKYIEIKDELSINEEELYDFNSIKRDEERVLRPIALQLEANYLRLDELNRIECRWYQKTCKKELKKDKAFLDADIKELKRQIWQKKEYYKILYLNATTREQDIRLRQIIHNKTKGKVQLW